MTNIACISLAARYIEVARHGVRRYNLDNTQRIDTTS